MGIKAIQTNYKGYKFRSRLEARWAVFFDALGWEWEYEVEGYKLKSGWYLPDFWLPQVGAFAEVKRGQFLPSEIDKCMELSLKNRVILLDGTPDFKAYQIAIGGSLSEEAVFMPDGSNYFPFYWTSNFDENYFTETVEAITEARSKRFEFDGK